MYHILLSNRLNEDELQRFYTAANGDFTLLLSSIKKTIRWRENYKILSSSELDMWSHMVFWHGFDLKHRPCLIVRLGLACMSLSSEDRPRFTQAISMSLYFINKLKTVSIHVTSMSPPYFLEISFVHRGGAFYLLDSFRVNFFITSLSCWNFEVFSCRWVFF